MPEVGTVTMFNLDCYFRYLGKMKPLLTAAFLLTLRPVIALFVQNREAATRYSAIATFYKTNVTIALTRKFFALFFYDKFH